MSDMELKIVPFKPGMELKVKGVPKCGCDRFSINVGHSRGNVALHFDVRFSYGNDQRVIVLNTRKNGHWQEEVRDRCFPFQPGQQFEVTIAFADGSFYINLHNGHVVQFPNRLGDKQYDSLWFYGDVLLNGLSV
ncbi:galactose-binding lectin l-1-like isoform X2 [Anguilla rostrata]|uniref:galactose-binding lectin l-1-like isoform X1 n=1 Tax=Anguilla rostrata TaxID=7938 RepID=UPI0030D4EAAC